MDGSWIRLESAEDSRVEQCRRFSSRNRDLPAGSPFGVDNDNFVFLALLVPVTMVGSAVALIRRFRRSSGVARIQLRWLAAAGGLVAATYAGLAGIHVAFDTGRGRVPRWLEIVSDVGILAFALVPISIGMAIVRYRLYDIDVIINRTLVYGASTAALTAGYIVLVTVMQGLLRAFAGRSQLAVAGSTLIVAAAFKPVRDRVQSTVDRRFYRSKVDAEATVQTFSARLRDEVSLETLTADLLAVVDRTMKPATSSLWLRPPDAGHAAPPTAGREPGRSVPR